jgi:hypothetical protein
VSSKHILKVQKKTVVIDNKKQREHRVWPFPDPQNVEGTTFLTKEQLHASAKQPSKQWVEAGGYKYGDYGTVHLEILGCDDLPNMVCTYMTAGSIILFNMRQLFFEKHLWFAHIHDVVLPSLTTTVLSGYRINFRQNRFLCRHCL